MLEIYFQDDGNRVEQGIKDKIDEVLTYAQSILAKNNEEVMEVAVVFVDNATIQKLNAQFRHKDVPTDVLSFPSCDQCFDMNEEVLKQLGDIIISVEKAQTQAQEYQHSIEREFVFLAVHGLLHLFGFDHHTAVEEEEMTKRQEQILSHFMITR